MLNTVLYKEKFIAVKKMKVYSNGLSQLLYVLCNGHNVTQHTLCLLNSISISLGFVIDIIVSKSRNLDLPPKL